MSTVKLLSQTVRAQADLRRWRSRAALLACCLALSVAQAAAQGYSSQGYSSQGYASQGGQDPRTARCQDLERQLVSDWQRTTNPQDTVLRIEQQLEPLQRQRRAAEAEAERRNCYEDMFIFGRSLRKTRECIQLDSDIEGFRRQITTLRQQRDALTSSASQRIRREDLVAELARNGCGENYRQEYENRRRRSTSLFDFLQEEDTSFDRRYANGPAPDQSNLPFSAYRTMCVRLCDGYYFPISFSTVGSRFAEDEAKCHDQCAAPTELYVYKNPGEDIQQMVSLRGEPYNGLKNAWRHQKQYVKGCSCKAAEYSTHQIELSEQELKKQASVSRPSSSRPSTQKSAQSNGPAPIADPSLDPQAQPSGDGDSSPNSDR